MSDVIRQFVLHIVGRASWSSACLSFTKCAMLLSEPHQATGDNDFDEWIQAGFKQVNDTETAELWRPSVFFEYRSDYVLPSMQRDAKFGT